MTSSRSNARDDRFTARLPRSEKALLQRAADLRGVPLSVYVFEKARAAATDDLANAGELTLTPDDQRRFVELLLNPPSPTPALVRALRKSGSPAKRP